MKIGTGPLSLIVALLSGALVSPLPAQINGVNDNIVSANLNNSGSYSLGSIAGLGGDLTIEGWVNLGSYANWARIVDLGNGATASNILLATEGTTGKPIFEIYNGSTSVGRVIAPNAVALNTWVHVAGVVQADRTMRLYVNGTQVATSTTSVDAPTVTRTSNFIGKSNWAGDSLLNGAVADVRIWNTARSQTEIQGNMDVGSIAGPTAGLVAGYTLGATGAAPLNDISGNGYTATQSGDITYSKFDTGTLTTGGFTGSTTTLNSAQGVLNLTGNNSVKNVTVNSAGISQAIGTLTTSQAGDGAFQVGVSSGQNGTYTLSGGTISVNGDGNVQIGASGTGTMNQSGGTFTGTEWMVIGRYTNSTGTYNLSGGTLRQSDAATKLIVGENGAGTLNVSGTGVVDSAGGLSISHGSSGVGTVNLNGGTILAPSIVKGSGDTATLNFNGGTLKATGNATNLISGLNTAALLAGGGTIDDGGFTVTMAQVLSGTGNFTKTGAGTLTLSGNSTYTGGTVVNAGTLALTGTLANNTNASITANNGGTFSIARDNFMGGHQATVLSPININAGGQVTGGTFLNTIGALNLNGGTLTSSGGNSFWGNLAFVLKGAVTASGDVTSTIGGSGAMMLGGDTVNSITFSVANGSADTDLLVSAVLDNGATASWPTRQASSLVKTGDGKMVLAANNTYSGTTTISGGVLQVGNGGTTGSLGSGNVTNNATLAVSRNNAYTLGNTISGTGSLVQAGTGTTTLSGNNSFSGGTFVNAGVLQANTEAQLGASNGAITLNGGQLMNNNSDLSLNAARTVTLGPSGGFFEAGWNRTITVAGRIGGTGGVGVVWNAGTLILSGSNSYAGATTIGTTGNGFYNNAAATPTLRLGNANALPSTSLLVFGTNAQNNTATLDLNGFAATVGGLSGSGNARITSGVGGAVTLTTAPTNGTATFAGIIGNGSGTVSLVKSGSGTQTLTGVNTFTGGTTVSGGTLALSNNNANVLSGAVTVNAGATLRAVGMNIISDTSALTLNGGTYAMGSNGDYIGSLTMNGNATVAGTSGTGGGQFILTTGQATNSTIKTLTASGTNNAINVNIGISSQWGGVGGNANLHFNVVGASDNLTVSGVIADKSFDGGGNATSGAITKTGQGTLVLLGNNSYSGGAVISSGTIQVGNGGTTGNITGNDAAIVNNGTLIINRANGFGLGNAISGGGALVQAGAGTTTVSGANSFTGGTTINAGALLLSAANRLADSGAVTVNGGSFNLGGFSDTVGVVTLAGGVITNGTLTGSSYDLQSGSVSAVLAGNATLTKTGAGVATLTASNTYTGPTVINEGRLATVGHNRIRSSNSVTVNTGGTFAIGGDQTLATIAGAGAVELGGRLTTGTSNSIFAGSMSGNGGLTKVGVGTFTLSGANTYVGDTLLTGGTLVLNNANALWTGGVLSMEAGTILTVNQRTFIGALDQGSGTVNGPGELVATLTLTESGALNAVLADGTDFAAGILKRTSGTTTIGAANTFTGAINVQGGTLQLAAGGSFNAASSLALSSGATMDLNNKAQTFSAVQGTGGTVALGSGSLAVSNAADNSFGGAITGTGGVTKNGAGMMELTGTNTYTGTTTVGAGTLAINGNNSAATGAVTVSSGATLAGSGTLGGATTIQSGATHTPGNSPGLQTFNSGLTYATSSTFQWELIGNTEDGRGTNFDGVNVSGGTLSIGSRVTSSLVFNTAGSSVSWADSFWESDRSWLVFANTNNPTLARTAVFDTINLSADSLGVTLTSVRSNASFAWNQQGSDVYLSYTAVPEPSTYALLVLAAAALGFHALRRRRRA